MTRSELVSLAHSLYACFKNHINDCAVVTILHLVIIERENLFRRKFSDRQCCGEARRGRLSSMSAQVHILIDQVTHSISKLVTCVAASLALASYPGSRGGGGKREPGTDRVRMRLIYQHSSNVVYHLDIFRKLRKRDVIKSVCRV